MYGLSWVRSCNGKESSGSGLFAKGVLLLLKKCSLSSQRKDHFIPDLAQVIPDLMILLLKRFTLLTIWYCGPWCFCGNYSGVYHNYIWFCTEKAKWRECESLFSRCLSLIDLLLNGNNLLGEPRGYLRELQLIFTLTNGSILRRNIWMELRQWRDCGKGKSFAKKIPIPMSSQLAFKPPSHHATTYSHFVSILYDCLSSLDHHPQPILFIQAPYPSPHITHIRFISSFS